MSNIIDTLVFDRTAADVARIAALASAAQKRPLTEAEVAEWNAAVVRGAYNAEDLNRVGAAAMFADAFLSSVQSEIDAYISALGVADDAIFDAQIGAASAIAPRTDYSRDESPLIYADVEETMRAAKTVAGRAGIAFDIVISRFDFLSANTVERAIHDAYRHGEHAIINRKDMADRIAAAWYYSGDLSCGDIT